jgi:hypothetical protein
MSIFYTISISILCLFSILYLFCSLLLCLPLCLCLCLSLYYVITCYLRSNFILYLLPLYLVPSSTYVYFYTCVCLLYYILFFFRAVILVITLLFFLTALFIVSTVEGHEGDMLFSSFPLLPLLMLL